MLRVILTLGCIFLATIAGAQERHSRTNFSC